MDDESEPNKRVYILPPSRILQKKIGVGNLDQALSPKAVASAQKIIEDSAGPLLEDSIAEFKKMEFAGQSLTGPKGKAQDALHTIMDAAFSLKSKVGLGDYILIYLLARSLSQQCEKNLDTSLTPSSLALIEWHITSIGQLIDMKVKKLGGSTGEAILEELKKLGVDVEPPSNA